MSSPLPPKKDVALALLERTSVFVYLDPRRDGVVTPIGFKKQPKLVLQVGMNMAVPIHDLKFDDQGMSCTLSFNRTPFFCIIPWSAVFALTGEDGQGLVWPEDVPRELVEAQQQQQRRATLHAVPDAPPSAPEVEAKKPAAKKPAAKKSDKSEAPAKKPAAKKSDKSEAPAKKPAAKQPAAKKPAAKKSDKSEAPAKKPAAKKPTAKQPAAKKSAPEAASLVRAPEKVAAPAPAVTPAAPAAAPTPRVIGKTKRELPPYLRVVK